MRSMFCAALCTVAALSGCATNVRFESVPTGATVTDDTRGMVLGKTPLEVSVSDLFGWFSVYRFTAVLEGYEPQALEFKERSPLEAQQVVPANVRFELKEKSASGR